MIAILNHKLWHTAALHKASLCYLEVKDKKTQSLYAVSAEFWSLVPDRKEKVKLSYKTRTQAETRSISDGTATPSFIKAAQVIENFPAQCPGADFHENEDWDAIPPYTDILLFHSTTVLYVLTYAKQRPINTTGYLEPW